MSTKKIDTKFMYRETELARVESFAYLGVLFNYRGNFKENAIRLGNKSLRAMFKISNCSKQVSLSAAKQLHVFDHTIKPIVLYCTEVTYEFNLSSKKNFEDLKCESILEKPHKNSSDRLWV